MTNKRTENSNKFIWKQRAVLVKYFKTELKISRVENVGGNQQKN